MSEVPLQLSIVQSLCAVSLRLGRSCYFFRLSLWKVIKIDKKSCRRSTRGPSWEHPSIVLGAILWAFIAKN